MICIPKEGGHHSTRVRLKVELIGIVTRIVFAKKKVVRSIVKVTQVHREVKAGQACENMSPCTMVLIVESEIQVKSQCGNLMNTVATSTVGDMMKTGKVEVWEGH